MLANLLVLLIPTVLSVDNNYTNGGSDWPGVCKNGSHQSPINLRYSRAYLPHPGSSSIITDFYNTTLFGNFSDRGLGFAGDYGNLTLSLDYGEFYAHILRMNFFAPSQHYINGRKYSMEVTLRFTPQPGYYLGALSVFFKTGASSPFIASVINYLNGTSNPLINLDSILDKEITNFYSYDGSLPVPPCTELIEWYIIPKILTLSSTQLKFFTDHWASNKTFAGGRGNTRYMQGLNSRTIYYYRGL
jgi:carbonic anhydrase